MKKLLPETRGILVLGMFDLISTSLLWYYELMEEINPFMNAILQAAGIPGLIVTKLLFLIPPLAGMEVLSRVDKETEQWVRKWLRFGLISYLILYVGGFIAIHLYYWIIIVSYGADLGDPAVSHMH